MKSCTVAEPLWLWVGTRVSCRLWYWDGGGLSEFWFRREIGINTKPCLLLLRIHYLPSKILNCSIVCCGSLEPEETYTFEHWLLWRHHRSLIDCDTLHVHWYIKWPEMISILYIILPGCAIGRLRFDTYNFSFIFKTLQISWARGLMYSTVV